MPELNHEPGAADGLTIKTAPGETTAVALVLHGGRARSLAPVRENQLAVLRMRPFATDLARAGRREGLTVARLRNQVRGWNGSLRSPVAFTEEALDVLAHRFPGVPIAVVGHSLGGRTAVYVAGHESVRAVVGLAPWLERGDPMQQLAGRRVLFIHGTRDRMTSATASEEFAEHARRYAESMSYVSLRDSGHAMLSRSGVWAGLVSGFVTGVLFGRPSGTGGTEVGQAVEQILAGKDSLDI